MILSLKTAPTSEPVSLSEAKAHLRVDGATDDGYIDALITVAREWVEAPGLNRSLITQTWYLVLDAWPIGNTITFPRPPLVSVTSVTYIDDAGVTRTLAASNYIVDTKSEPGRLVLTSAASWPTESLRAAAAITVEFVAGYGAAAPVPTSIKQAMLLLIGHWYENREVFVESRFAASLTEAPYVVDALLSPHRVIPQRIA